MPPEQTQLSVRARCNKSAIYRTASPVDGIYPEAVDLASLADYPAEIEQVVWEGTGASESSVDVVL